MPESSPHEAGRDVLYARSAVAPGCSRAESQAGLTLEKKLPVSFAQLSNVVELGDGRVAFADTKAKLFLPGRP